LGPPAGSQDSLSMHIQLVLMEIPHSITISVEKSDSNLPHACPVLCTVIARAVEWPRHNQTLYVPRLTGCWTDSHSP
jgi:hypothetical protein